MNVYGRIPTKVRAALKSKSRFKCGYDPGSGHFIASKTAYDTRQAAIGAAAEQGIRPDVDQLEDVRLGWAAFRFNGTGPSRYCEVDAGARGAFPVWIFPAILPED